MVDALAHRQAIAATVSVALEQVRKQSPAAAELIALCSFLGADDVPRAMLYEGSTEVSPAMRGAIADPSALGGALEVLSRFDLVSINADAIALHREVQASVREALSDQERESWAVAAGQVVLAALPRRPENSRAWPQAARLVPHAISVMDHLDALRTEPLLAVRLRTKAARYLLQQGQLVMAAGMLEHALETARELEPNGILHGTVLLHSAAAARLQGHLNHAQRDAEHALAIHLAALRPLESDAVSAASDLDASRKGAAEAHAQLGAEARSSAQAHLVLAEDHHVLADITSLQGDNEVALEHCRTAQQMIIDLYAEGEADPGLVDVLVTLLADVLGQFFAVYLDEERYGEALGALQGAADVLEERYGSTDPEVVESRKVLAIFTEPENYVEHVRDVVQLNETTYGPRHPRTADACMVLAGLLRPTGQLEEARQLLDRARDIHEGNYGPTHPKVAACLAALAVLDASEGQHELAESGIGAVCEIVRAAPRAERLSSLRLSGMSDTIESLARLPAGRDLVLRARTTLGDRFAGEDDLIAFADELVVKAFQSGGDERLSGGDVAEATSLFQEGLKFAHLTTENFLDDARLYIRLGTLAGMTNDADTTRAHFQEALEFLARGGYSVPVWELVRVYSKVRIIVGGPVPLADEILHTMTQEAIEGGLVPAFRGKLTAAIPEDWFAKESTTVLSPDGQANVIASGEPLDASITTSQYADVQGELLRSEFPEYKEHAYEQVEIFGGRQGYLRHFEWTPPDGEPVTQIQLYYTEAGRGYTATATTPREAFPSREVLLRQVLLGLRIESAPSGSG